MGIARSVEPQRQETEQREPIEQTEATQVHIKDGVPFDVWQHFDIDPFSHTSNNEKDNLRAIWEWAKKDAETLGDALIKIRELENKLGMGGYERIHSKMARWVRLTRHIDDKKTEREALQKPTWD